MENNEKNQSLDEWAAFKKKIQQEKRKRNFREGEIWWTAVGENIGVEINGKNERFSRPVLILKKYGQLGFAGVPLTSRDKNNDNWYMSFRFNDGDSEAALTQTKLFSVYRLLGKMGKVTDTDLEIIKEAYREMFR